MSPNNFIMEALIANSRSVSQDRFLKKQQDFRYTQHLHCISSITNKKEHPHLAVLKEAQEVTMRLQKSKDAARKFKEKEISLHNMQNNKFLLKKLISMESTIKVNHEENFKLRSASNWLNRKRHEEEIKVENKKIALRLAEENSISKVKIVNQMKQYLELRDKIRRVKSHSRSQSTLRKTKRALSEQKLPPASQVKIASPKNAEQPLEEIIVETKQ